MNTLPWPGRLPADAVRTGLVRVDTDENGRGGACGRFPAHHPRGAGKWAAGAQERGVRAEGQIWQLAHREALRPEDGACSAMRRAPSS